MNLSVAKRDRIDPELLGLLKANTIGPDSRLCSSILNRPTELMDGVFLRIFKSGYEPVAIKPQTHTGVPARVMRPQRQVGPAAEGIWLDYRI